MDKGQRPVCVQAAGGPGRPPCDRTPTDATLVLYGHQPYSDAMATKTRRMEQRIDEETDALLTRAAAVTHESVSAFVVRSARTEASRVLARADVTLMPEAQFDRMLAALDEAPRRIPALADAAARTRRLTHE